MAITHVTQDNHDELIEGLTILYFWAPWCGPCRQFGPIYESISDEFPGVTFGKINVDENQGLARQYQVQSIPSIVAYKNGKAIFARPGGLASTDLRKLAKKLLK